MTRRKIALAATGGVVALAAAFASVNYAQASTSQCGGYAVKVTQPDGAVSSTMVWVHQGSGMIRSGPKGGSSMHDWFGYVDVDGSWRFQGQYKDGDYDYHRYKDGVWVRESSYNPATGAYDVRGTYTASLADPDCMPPVQPPATVPPELPLVPGR